MGVKVTELIALAYNQGNLAPVNYQPLDDSQLKAGLYALNQVLGEILIDDGLVPYWKRYDDTFVVNQETYTIPYLINVQTFTFLLEGQVRYPIMPDNFRDYWGSAKAVNIQTLPSIFTIKRTLGGSEVSVTQSPNKAYPFTIFGAFGLLSIDYNDDLSEIYDQYYITYLTAKTARMICVNASMEIPSELQRHIADYEQKIRNKSQPLDLTNSYVSMFGGTYTYNYMQASIGNGYTATSRSHWR